MTKVAKKYYCQLEEFKTGVIYNSDYSLKNVTYLWKFKNLRNLSLDLEMYDQEMFDESTKIIFKHLAINCVELMSLVINFKIEMELIFRSLNGFIEAVAQCKGLRRLHLTNLAQVKKKISLSPLLNCPKLKVLHLKASNRHRSLFTQTSCVQLLSKLKIVNFKRVFVAGDLLPA